MIPAVESPFWTGIVEDRHDPLFLGRCRVRIHGWHSKFKAPGGDSTSDDPQADYIPTENLPWALPVNSITSASMTGIGQAPVGPVEGTWVVGFFMDGGDHQIPVFIGTIGGIELKQDQQNANGNDSPGINTSPQTTSPTPGSPIQPDPSPPPPPSTPAGSSGGIGLGSLTADQYAKYKNAIGARESSGNYQAVNQLGYLGKYQMGGAALCDGGFVKTKFNKNLPVATDWTGQDGCDSQTAFLNNPAAQETQMDSYTQKNYQTLLANGTLTADSSPQDVAGYLAAAHLTGPAAAKRLKDQGTTSSDANGTSNSSYYNLGAKAIGGSTPTVPSPPPPQPTIATQPSNAPLATSPGATSSQASLGFRDPNQVYPRFNTVDKRPDTSFLAYSDHLDLTCIKIKRDHLVKGVTVANDASDPWDQPDPPFNATYPYNHILETESGHVFEMDDTAANERVHLFHKTGTFVEVDANGTRVNRIVGDDYWICDRNGYISFGGKVNITVDGSANLYVKVDANIQVDGKTHLVCGNDVKGEISGNLDFNVLDKFNVKAKQIHFETTDTDDNAQKDGWQEAFTIRNNNANGSIRVYSVGKIEHWADKNMSFYSDKKISLRATTSEGEIAIDATDLKLQKDDSEKPVPKEDTDAVHKVAEVLQDDEGMKTPKDQLSPTDPTFQTLSTPNGTDKHAFFYDDGFYPPDEVNAYKAEQLNQGNMTPYQLNQQHQQLLNNTTPDNTPAPLGPSVPQISSPLPAAITQMTGNIPVTTPLSSNFNLGMLTNGSRFNPASLIGQRGLTTGALAGNLSILAQSALEPILAQFPNMLVAGGFRLALPSTIISEHELGQAADMLFPGVDQSGYYDVASWIRDNVPCFNNLNLCYSTIGSGPTWIHISVSPTANLKNVVTLVNAEVIGQSLTTTNQVQTAAGAVATMVIKHE